MIDVEQFTLLVIRPTLQYMDMWSESAENLVLGTAVHESRLKSLKQIGGGPAVGLYQMEPASHDDDWNTYLHYNTDKAAMVRSLASARHHGEKIPSNEMITNLAYATAMTRVHYYRHSEPLPRHDDIEGLGKYWKKYYNTEKGKGKVKDFVNNYMKAVK